MKSLSDARRWTALPILIGLIVLAVGVRSAVLTWRFSRLDDDPDAYRLLAENLSSTGVYGQIDRQGHAHPTAFRPPGYPLLLSLFVRDGQLSSGSVALLHLFLGTATVVAVFFAGKRLHGPRVGTIAGVLVAIDPILLGQSTLVMTETVATLLSAVAWLLAIHMTDPSAEACASDTADSPQRRGERRRRQLTIACLLGASISAGFLCRPIFIVWFALMLPIWLIFARRTAKGAIVVVVAIVGLTVAAWTYRNHVQLHHNILVTTHGGYTLLLANNPPFYRYLRGNDSDSQAGAKTGAEVGEKWDATFFHQRWARRYEADPRTEAFWDEQPLVASKPNQAELTEVQEDRLAYESAMATIRRQPRMFAYSCLVRLARLWSLAPHKGDVSQRQRQAIFVFYAAMALFVLAGIAGSARRLARPAWLSGLAMAVALSCVHSIYWSNMRMRAPATPMIAMLAAVGIAGRRPKPTQTSFEQQEHDRSAAQQR